MRCNGRRAFVLGGGVAGLAAAFGLRDRGFEVTLLEGRSWLGGRAFSFADGRTGTRLDNGPHVMLGCYDAMRRLLRRLGSEQRFLRQRALTLAYRDASGSAARLRLSRLPAPLAMPAALWRLPLGRSARCAALRGMLGSLLGAPAAWTLSDWLERKGQQGAPASYLWRPLCRAVMNVEPALASARLFLATLRQAFAGSAGAAAFWVPQQPWGALVGDAAAARLVAEGVDLRLGAHVAALPRRERRIAAIELLDGGSVTVGPDDVVCSALPWYALDRLLDGALGTAALGSSPLVSIHFDGALGAQLPDDGPVTALVDGEPFHFVYRTPGAPRQRVTLLAGGNRDLDGIGTAAIERLARAQLGRHYPGVDQAAPAAVRVSKEARATFVASPQAERMRPPPGPLPRGGDNLFVCGDWTASGLPATLEGAARSAAAMLQRMLA